MRTAKAQEEEEEEDTSFVHEKNELLTTTTYFCVYEVVHPCHNHRKELTKLKKSAFIVRMIWEKPLYDV